MADQKRILVLGATGMIGHQVFNYLKLTGLYDMHSVAYRKKIDEGTVVINAVDEKTLLDHITSVGPDIIINCMGILINEAESHPERAIYLNAYLPHRLSRHAYDLRVKLIHISTDCVFSGDKKTPYIETDLKDGSGVYARTKALGEFNNDHHLILRTSVVGPELKRNGEELFHWFMQQSGDIKGYTKSIWSGVTTCELAKVIGMAIEEDLVGLYHVTNNASISKYELLKLFKRYTQKDINIAKIDGYCSDKSFVDSTGLIAQNVPSYEDMICEMVELINQNKNLYSQYVSCSKL